MQVVRPSPDTAPWIVRVMKTVALAAGEIAPGARALIAAAQDFLVGSHLDLDAVPSVTPAERAAALAELAPGTLGGELHRYDLRNGCPRPGQKRAAPEAIVSHDVTHILSGYDTDPAGETLVAAFTAGYQREPGRFITPLVNEPVDVLRRRWNVEPE
jgi:hypothetical protein